MTKFFRAIEKLKNRRGVTLVELIMVMAIMAILGVAVMTLTTSSLNMYTKGRDLITKKEVAEIVEQYITQKVEKATTLKIQNSGTKLQIKGSTTLYVGAGKDTSKTVLYDTGTRVFGADETSEKAIYGSYSIGLKFEKSGDVVLLVTITVSGGSDSNYTKTFSPILLNSQSEEFSFS